MQNNAPNCLISAGDGDDKIGDGGAANTLSAGRQGFDLRRDGTDRLNGNGGNDRLFGEGGSDRLYGYDWQRRPRRRLLPRPLLRRERHRLLLRPGR
jgi:hypothetical protein